MQLPLSLLHTRPLARSFTIGGVGADGTVFQYIRIGKIMATDDVPFTLPLIAVTIICMNAAVRVG